MTKKTRPAFDHETLHVELFEIVKQYSTGLLTDIELLQCCDRLKELYEQVDMSTLHDPNTGLRYPADYKPFAK